jgi:hypothetical protein
MAVKFSQFDGTITPVKTSETQFIVGFEGTTNAKWTMKALADEIGGGNNIYTADGTLTGNRTVTQDGNQLSWDMGTGSQTFTTSSSSGTWMNLRVGGGQKGALLAVSGGGGMYFRDSGGSDYYSVSQNGLYLNRNAGFGITAQANQRVTIKGSGNTGATTSLLVQNSNNEAMFTVRDDKYTTVNVNNGIENGFIIKNVATYTMLDAGDDGGNSAQMRMYEDNFVRFYFKASQGLMVADSGNNGSSGASSVLTATSNTRGFLPPRNADPASNITTPVAGLVAYDTTDNKLQFYNGTAWTDAGGGGDSIYTASDSIPSATNRTVTLAGTATLQFAGAVNQGDFRIGDAAIGGRSNYSIKQSGDVISHYCYQSNYYVNSDSDPTDGGLRAGTNYLSVSSQGLEHHKVSVGVGINGTTNDRLVVKGASITSAKHSVRVLDSDDASMFSIRNDGNFMLGKSAVSSTPNNVVIGGGATDTAASNSFNVIIGKDASITGASNQGCVVIGDGSLGTAGGSIAVGSQAKAKAVNAIAIGQRAQPTGANSITLDASGSGLTTPSTANTFGVYMTSNTTPDFRVIGAEGMVPPSITTTVRDAISSPATGSTIYNTTDNKLQFYNGSAWENAGGGSSLWVEDANNPGNISPANGNDVDVAIGTTPVNAQRLVVRGSSSSASGVSLKCEDNAGVDKFIVRDNGNVEFTAGGGFGVTTLKTYGNSGVTGTTLGNSNGNSFVIGTAGLGTTGSRFTIGAVPANGTSQFNLFTTGNGTGDAVQWKNSSSELLLDMKENGRTSFHGQVSVGVGSGSNATIDFDTGNIQEITIPTETATPFTPTNAVAGSTYIIKITQAGTSGTMNWESSATVNWPGGTAPTLTATSAGVDIITLVCTAGGATGGTFYGTSALNFS